MSHSPRPTGSGPAHPRGADPWAAFGYLVAGVGFYGLIGWGLGVWLHARYLTAVGVVVGAALGLVLVVYTLNRAATGGDPAPGSRREQADDNAPHDRGETE